MYERSETRIDLGIRDLPRETSENHTHEDDSDTPDVGLSWIVSSLWTLLTLFGFPVTSFSVDAVSLVLDDGREGVVAAA